MDVEETETTNNWMKETEIVEFYRALALTQAKMFLYLGEAPDFEELKKRTAELTEKLKGIKLNYGEDGGKCAEGSVWNPLTQRCE